MIHGPHLSSAVHPIYTFLSHRTREDGRSECVYSFSAECLNPICCLFLPANFGYWGELLSSLMPLEQNPTHNRPPSDIILVPGAEVPEPTHDCVFTHACIVQQNTPPTTYPAVYPTPNLLLLSFIHDMQWQYSSVYTLDCLKWRIYCHTRKQQYMGITSNASDPDPPTRQPYIIV